MQPSALCQYTAKIRSDETGDHYYCLPCFYVNIVNINTPNSEVVRARLEITHCLTRGLYTPYICCACRSVITKDRLIVNCPLCTEKYAVLAAKLESLQIEITQAFYIFDCLDDHLIKLRANTPDTDSNNASA
jgi:hypothetical protein